VSPKTKSKSSKPGKSGKSGKSVKPPTVVVSTRVDRATFKSLVQQTKKAKYKNLSDTISHIIQFFFNTLKESKE
jgi:hypothetical protein